MKAAVLVFVLTLLATLPAFGFGMEIPVTKTTSVSVTNTYVVPQGEQTILLDQGRQTTSLGNAAWKHNCAIALKSPQPQELVLSPADYSVVKIEYALDMQPMVDLSSSLFSQRVVLHVASKTLDYIYCYRTNDREPVVHSFANIRQVLAGDAIFLRP